MDSQSRCDCAVMAHVRQVLEPHRQRRGRRIRIFVRRGKENLDGVAESWRGVAEQRGASAAAAPPRLSGTSCQPMNCFNLLGDHMIIRPTPWLDGSSTSLAGRSGNDAVWQKRLSSWPAWACRWPAITGLGYGNSAAGVAVPACGDDRQRHRNRPGEERRMNSPTFACDTVLCSGFMLFALLLLVGGLSAPVWAMWKWHGGWRQRFPRSCYADRPPAAAASSLCSACFCLAADIWQDVR